VSKLIMCYTQEAHVHDMQHIDMDGTSGVAGGQLPPCALCPAPVVVRKIYVGPLDPSRSLSQRKFM